MSKLSIGNLARAGDVSVDTVRYYERVGLLFPIERAESGYRKYSYDSIKRLLFIRRAQNLGFTLEEIKELLNLSDHPEADCGDVRRRACDKISEIEEKIADLERMKKSLLILAEYCPGQGKPLSECGIIHHFYEEGR